MTDLSCFKAYDIRGEIGVNIDEHIAYRIGRAVGQHFCAKSIIIGFDARETSPVFAAAASRGVMDAGADVFHIGMTGTEEMYCAVTEFGACAGIEVTASHNPINYNGMKIVKSESRPLDDLSDFQVIKALVSAEEWVDAPMLGREFNYSTKARQSYVDRVIGFAEASEFRHLKIVVNSGNGAAGPTFDAIADRLQALGAPLEFIRVHHKPDMSFPNGIPNPLLPENQADTADVVKSEAADFGVAFDGDFDRCFFFDEAGQFVPGEYVVGLLASIFLEKEPGGKIVHDSRVIWNTQDIVMNKGGDAVQSKPGHVFIKQVMRAERAIYGGEMSAHHYFRDFYYCDSGMIPWILIAERLSSSGQMLSALIKERRQAFRSSGEYNFMVENVDCAIARVIDKFKEGATRDDTDGVSLDFNNWRFNLRKSNTEPLVRLNLEARGTAVDIDKKVQEISGVLTSG